MSGTVRYSNNYGWNGYVASSPHSSDRGYINKMSDLRNPSNNLLCADAATITVAYWDYKVFPTDPRVKLRYRHGGSDKYGHGGSSINVLWGDLSARSTMELMTVGIMKGR